MSSTFSDETWRCFKKYVSLLGDGSVVSAGLHNKSKSYRIHLVADLPEGVRKEWRSTPIKRPKGRKTGRDRGAEHKFFEDWWPSEGGNVVERLRYSRHRIEAEAEAEVAQLEPRDRGTAMPAPPNMHAPRSAAATAKAQAGHAAASARRSYARDCKSTG
ncbi:unnamed protein product [Pylaiella littoralis]